LQGNGRSAISHFFPFLAPHDAEHEVLKLQKKLEVSNASNFALVAHLESVTPQLLGLEKEIQQLGLKLEDEVILRRQAEQEQDKAESARRAAESTIQRLQVENDALREELAFHSSELEEMKSALHEVTLRQEEECNMFRKQLKELPEELSLAHGSDSSVKPDLETLPDQMAQNGFSHDTVQDQLSYIKSLEDELELVTKQLIDTQKC
jgi:chromosome segregation ATPase